MSSIDQGRRGDRRRCRGDRARLPEVPTTSSTERVVAGGQDVDRHRTVGSCDRAARRLLETGHDLR